MPKYVALLRGIGPSNPNMHGQKLKEFFEELGFSGVKTVISSGNVVFETSPKSPAKLEAQIEKALPDKLGFSSTTIVRSQAELQKLVEFDPYKGTTHSPTSYQLVTFFKYPTKVDLKLPYQPPGRSYKLLGSFEGAVYSIMDQTTGKTPDLMVWLEKQFGKDITSRTWLTVGRILKKMAES